MPEPFKELFNREAILALAEEFSREYSEFDANSFFSSASTDLDSLELKQRSNQICTSLDEHLPNEIEHFSSLVLRVLSPLKSDGEPDGSRVQGWMIMPLADLVTQRLIGDPERAMTLHKALTIRFSCEFAIRPLLIAHTGTCLRILGSWVDDSNRHVRRLISEGTRPRLPWGQQLPMFIKDPSETIKLLEQLKTDREEYVRRSVANHLNDIAKDHPKLVSDIATQWLNEPSEDEDAKRRLYRLVRHACRTLLKKAHKPTLAAFGYGAIETKEAKLEIKTPRVDIGSALEFTFYLTSLEKQPVMVDYILHLKKANGSHTAKVFKWKDVSLHPDTKVHWSKSHSFKPVTVRKYYPGEHFIEIMVNGRALAKKRFDLV